MNTTNELNLTQPSTSRRHFSKEFKHAVMTEIFLGATKNEVCLRYNLKPSTLNSWLRELNKLTSENNEAHKLSKLEATEMYRSGVPFMQLCLVFGTNPTTLASWLFGRDEEATLNIA